MTKRNFSIMSIIVLALMFMAVVSPRADARSTYLTSCMTAASDATGCHPSAAGIAGKAPTLTSSDCKSCHHHGLSTTPVVTTDKTTYASTDNILFKFTGGSQQGRAGLVIYNLAGTSEVARGVIAEDGSQTLSVPASTFGAITNTAIKTAWHGNAMNSTGGTGSVCTAQTPCTAHDFSAVINTPAITITSGTGCTRVAPSVTYNTTAQNVTAGGTVTYTATVTNNDTTSCSSSSFTLSIASETGTSANFVLPSTLSTTSCSNLAPGGTCTSTLTVKAQSAATAGATNTTTVRAADSTNHGTLPGSGAVTTTIQGAVSTSYKVIAYNDLGMHCACPGSQYFSVLPPFNAIRAQVLQIGAADPVVVSSGVNVTYAMATTNETDAYLQADNYFSNIIAYGPKMFPGYQPVVNNKIVSISGAGLAGSMAYNSQFKAYEVIGVPAFPVPTGTSADILTDPIDPTLANRDPYLQANITVTDTSGNTLATTSTTVPVAWGGCCSCHIQLAKQHGKKANLLGSFQYMGSLHGQNSSKIDFSLIDPDGDGKPGPIRCSWCHWDPAMGETSAKGLPYFWPNYKILRGANFTSADIKVSTRSFSDVLHQFHVKSTVVLTQFDANIAKNCYDCHPGNGANCYRGAMHSAGVNCYDCHGDLNQRVAAGQLTQPWQQSTLPTCNAPSAGATTTFACHSSSTYPTPGTWNNGLYGKYINSRGHQGSILCSTCHGSPHAEAPSTLAQDNNQNMSLQNDARPLGKCSICHPGMSSTWAVPPHANITQ